MIWVFGPTPIGLISYKKKNVFLFFSGKMHSIFRLLFSFICDTSAITVLEDGSTSTSTFRLTPSTMNRTLTAQSGTGLSLAGEIAMAAANPDTIPASGWWHAPYTDGDDHIPNETKRVTCFSFSLRLWELLQFFQKTVPLTAKKAKR